MNFDENLESFYEVAHTLKTEEDKASFSRIANRLLNETFLIKTKAKDKADYYFVHENFNLFESFFALIDYECRKDNEKGLVFINTSLDRNRVRLTKFETVICLQLRLFYYIRHKEISETDRIMVSLEELEEAIRNTQIFMPPKKITEYSDSLRKLRRIKLIDFESSKISPETRLEILSPIMVVVSINDMEELGNKLKTLAREVETEDERID